MALLTKDHDENLLNLSTPSVLDSYGLTLVVQDFTSFHTSASSTLRVTSSALDIGTSDLFLKNSGPLIHSDSVRSLACRPRVARSAGLLQLSTYLYWSGEEILRMICMRLAT